MGPARMTRYYFQISDAAVLETVEAESLQEAKAKVFDEWASLWPRIEWLHPKTHDEVNLPNV